MSTSASIRVEFNAGMATVSLAQPERGNPFDGDFTRDFRQVVCDLWDREDLRSVLLRADGGNFSFGGDLKALQPAGAQLPALVRSWTADLHMGLQRLWTLPVPIVCAVQGFAMGGGVALLAGCDVVIAAESAKFGSAFARIGFSCDSGTSAVLTARMGMARARRFVLLGEMLTASEALNTGLVDMVVPLEAVQQKAEGLTRELAEGPTLAYGGIKRLFLDAGQAQLQAQLENEALTLARVAASADALEGVAAMIQRRAAVFMGR